MLLTGTRRWRLALRLRRRGDRVAGSLRRNADLEAASFCQSAEALRLKRLEAAASQQMSRSLDSHQTTAVSSGCLWTRARVLGQVNVHVSSASRKNLTGLLLKSESSPER